MRLEILLDAKEEVLAKIKEKESENYDEQIEKEVSEFREKVTEKYNKEKNEYLKDIHLQNNEIELELEPNKVTCIKSYIGGFIQNIQFEKVDFETCKKEIVETKKIVQ